MNRKSFELKFCFLFVSIAFAFFLGLPLANLAYKSAAQALAIMLPF